MRSLYWSNNILLCGFLLLLASNAFILIYSIQAFSFSGLSRPIYRGLMTHNKLKERESQCSNSPAWTDCWSFLTRTLPLVVYISSFTPAAAYSEEVISSFQWTFGNDQVVHIQTPLSLSKMQLFDPQLLGAGGGGTVLAMKQVGNLNNDPSNSVAVKISWIASAKSVEKECKILETLEQSNVHGVEQCLGTERYPLDARRVMIALKPVFADDVSSISDLENDMLQRKATTQLMQTLVEMLAARVVTTDVQILVSKTGDILLVDLTEAKLLSSTAMSLIDLSLAASFCSEMLALVPPSMEEYARLAVNTALQSATTLPIRELQNVLLAQVDGS